MPEETSAPTNSNLNSNLSQAITICHTLQHSLLCSACGGPHGNARPWRSRNCEHTFCASCAAVARGRLGPVASRAVFERRGKCPMPGCNIPLRPADVVEDVGVRAVLDACRGLVSWAAEAKQREGNTHLLASQDIFKDDVTLGPGLAANQ